MNRFLLRRLILADCENLLDLLTVRQHVAPHEPVERALARAVEQLGVCPGAVEHGVRWLQLDASTPIGRLRRTELMQLARTVHRFWRQRRPATSSASPTPASP